MQRSLNRALVSVKMVKGRWEICACAFGTKLIIIDSPVDFLSMISVQLVKMMLFYNVSDLKRGRLFSLGLLMLITIAVYHAPRAIGQQGIILL